MSTCLIMYISVEIEDLGEYPTQRNTRTAVYSGKKHTTVPGTGFLAIIFTSRVCQAQFFLSEF